MGLKGRAFFFLDETLTLSGLAVAQGHAVASKRDHLGLVLYVKVIQGCFLELLLWAGGPGLGGERWWWWWWW